MPQYARNVTAAASTVQITDLRLEPGQITRIEVIFPPGCAGLVEVDIRRGAATLWPSNENEVFIADGYVIGWNEEYDLPEATTMRLRVNNTDDTFSHTIGFLFTVRDARRVEEARGLLSFFAQLRRGLGL